MTPIPVASPSMTTLEQAYVADALASGRVSGTGPYVERFEQAWAHRCGVEHAVAVSSGTAALHALLLAHGAGRGDEVIVPALTYAAVANAVRHTGAVPVVADVDERTWCLSPAAAAAAVTARTVGIVAVHAYGHPADLPPLLALARRHGLWVIEDGAEAHLARCRGRTVGGLADGGAFSFFGNKILTAGEGGAITVHDLSMADRLRAVRHQGVWPGRDDRYAPSLLGHSFRMSNLAAAVACAQVERADELIARRSAVLAAYDEAFAGVAGVARQPSAAWAEPVPWLCSILVEPVDGEGGRDRVAAALSRAGVETRALFPPLGTLPAGRPARHRCPVAADLSHRGLSLPVFPDLSVTDVERIAAVVAGRHQRPLTSAGMG